MDYILWEISYANFIMLHATIPVYEKDEKTKKDEKIEAVESFENLDDFLNS